MLISRWSSCVYWTIEHNRTLFVKIHTKFIKKRMVAVSRNGNENVIKNRSEWKAKQARAYVWVGK
jgi:hypothetical protein